MKKYSFVLISFLCLSFNSMSCQTEYNDEEKNIASNDFLKEKIFVHFNSTFLVSGDNLYYKIYCLNADTNTQSSLSKIAYVELINSDKNTIFKHKVLLKSGLGKGDFFIQTSIPSGNYKLVAYTQWMRNGGEKTFFQNDITIINPFKANTKLSVRIPKQNDTISERNLLKQSNVKITTSSIKNEFIEISTNKNKFNKREKVDLIIKGFKNAFSYGNYSISVKKIDAVLSPPMYSSKWVFDKKLYSKSKDSVFFMPELRGELLFGSILMKETNTPMPNLKVSLSIPGENSIFKMATTNEKGIFYFNLDTEYQRPNAIIQVIDAKREKYKVKLTSYESPSYDNFVFNDFELTSQLEDVIVKKSISNQVENAYQSVKRDSVLPIRDVIPTYKHREKTYFLNDYSRFNTLKETIVEVVDAVYLLQEKGDFTFHVKFYDDILKSDELPLVLIDGVLIQDHNSIIDYDAKDIKSIGVVRDKYIYGGKLYLGIVAIETVNRDFNYLIKGEHMKNFKLNQPLVNKLYFQQEYTNNYSSSRIPDFRNQLLWYPNFVLSSNKALVSFYTSDSTGDFELCLEGYTNTGEAISVKEIISVN